MTDLKKSSCTLNGVLSSKFDLDVMYENLKIENGVVEVKYNGKKKNIKGQEECKTFNNQVTVRLDNNVNIKIFSSNTFSITGAGNVDIALENSKKSLEKLLFILKNIKIDRQVKLTKNNGFYVYYDNRIISSLGDGCFTQSLENKITKENIVLHGNNCVKFDIIPTLYIQVKHNNKQKLVYNNLAQEVGIVEYFMKRNTKSLCIKGCRFVENEQGEYDILNSYNNNLGVLKIKLYPGMKIEQVELPEYVNFQMKVCREDVSIVDIKFSNCNYNMKTGGTINREKICRYLSENSIDYVYNPSSYPGVKFSIDDAKITVFRTGSVLFSSKTDIYPKVYPTVMKIFENDFSDTKEDEIDCRNDSLTIWDI